MKSFTSKARGCREQRPPAILSAQMKLAEFQPRTALLCVALALTTIVVYWPVRGQQFVNMDDELYVTENPHVLNGLTSESVRWAFTTSHGTHWLPVTWLSHMLDCQLFGVHAGAHKLVNVTFHIASTVLLFLVLKRATSDIWPSAFVAAVFALHPLRVESVAWVAERKDVLSAFFWMLTLWAYVRYVERPGVGRYLWIVLFFVLGLMAKPMVVTLPFVLLLLDFWPLGRTPWAAPAREGFSRCHPKRLTLEKLPLLVLALISTGVQFWVTHSMGAIVPTGIIPIGLRVSNALVSYGRYLGKMLWPQNLAVLYPFPEAWSLSLVVTVVLFLTCVSVVVARAAKRQPHLIVGWLWYLGTLVPVIGLVQVGLQSMADRFTYIPMVGILIGVAWGAADAVADWPRARMAAVAGAAAVVCACAVATRVQLQYWRDSVTLFERAAGVTGDNYLAQSNLGVALSNRGRIEEGMAHLMEAVRLCPNSAYAHQHLGRACFLLGRIAEGIDHLRKAVALDPDSAAAHNNLGVALVKEGQLKEATVEFAEAVRLQPDYALARVGLGGVLVSLGRIEEALQHLHEAVRLRPDSADAHINLGFALAAQEKFLEAISHYEQAVRLKPEYPEAHDYLGVALRSQGQLTQAVVHFTEAVRLKPDYAEAQFHLGAALAQQGRTAEAREHLDAAVKLDPRMAAARHALEENPSEKTP
jgi:tetratricopeptide (TPR) repeat protein